MKNFLVMNRRFLRSVNITADKKSKEGLSGYIVTPSVRSALARIALAFQEEITERAFTLTGPYGTGKSSFALFLMHLLSKKDDAAWGILQDADKKLAQTLESAFWRGNAGKGTLPLPITSRCAPVAELLAEALDGADIAKSAALLRNIEQLRSSRDTRKSMTLVANCVKEICAEGHDGVFFIFDEFGKLFEEAKRGSGKVDVFMLQELAEAASRSVGKHIYFLGILHQSIADYAGSEMSLLNEFRKVEGRFEPITFIETPSTQIRLAAAAFPAYKPHGIERKNAKALESALQDVGLAGLVGLADAEFVDLARRAMPLHPLTLAALPLLFRRFGQNERSIFSFLTSNESKGFLEFVSSGSNSNFFRLCDLFDYFIENYEAQLASRSFGHPFIEALATIQSKASLTPIEAEAIKSIAVLTSLGLQSQIHATEEMISFALAPNRLDRELHSLKEKSILVYRRFNRTFALWNGSDIDLNECCKQADIELRREHFSVSNTFSKFMPPTPMIAKRHSISKGSLRFFDVVYLDSVDDVDAFAPSRNSGAAGTIVVCFTGENSIRNAFVGCARRSSEKDKSLIFAIPTDITDLTSALMEVRRLNWVSENEKKLRDDRIATREIAIRLALATQAVKENQSRILDPRPASHGGGGCKYIHNGQELSITSLRQASELISDVCDSLYDKAPVIRNELINRRTPSSQAAAARRIVINALNNPETIGLERFGIDGYPPERSIYESVIASAGIHKLVDGNYALSAPDTNSPVNLRPAWDRIDEITFAKNENPVVLRNLYAELSKPPYGVMDGLMPILLAAFYAVNRDEVSLYAEGTFVPDPQEAHLELMIRRPDLFAISGMHVTGTRKQIVDRLAGGLQTEPKVLAVVRRLYTMMNSLTKFARETNRVSEESQKFRRAFFEAKSPEKLLFVSIPESFGLKAISGVGSDKKVFDTYFEKLNNCLHELARAFPKLVDESRKYLLECCGCSPQAEGWKNLYDKASFLLARLGGSELCPFLKNVVNTDGDWGKAEQVLSFIQQMPISKWGTSQIEEFRRAALGIGERYKAVARPYDFTPANLSKSDKKAAQDLKGRFASFVGRSKPAVVRAALLAYLEEMQREENV